MRGPHVRELPKTIAAALLGLALGCTDNDTPTPEPRLGGAPTANTLQVPSAFPTIEAAIAAAGDGDTVLVDAGTYTPAGGRLIIEKKINILAAPSLETRPTILTNYAGWTDCAIQIAADDVRFEGFEVDNSAAGTLAGYIIGDYVDQQPGHDDWAVRNCDVHDGANAIRAVGDGITIEYNDLHETSSDLINCEYGDCFGLKVSHNWLHSDHPTSTGKPAGITYACSSSRGANVEISYNYAWGSRTFIDFQSQGDVVPSNTIFVHHNTVDFGLEDLPDPVGPDAEGQQMSIAWWTDEGHWSGSNFLVRDNLFTRQKWYQVVDTDALLQGQIILLNNMFWKWYLASALVPYENGLPNARGAVGWPDMTAGTGNGFVAKPDITARDPLYAGVGTTPDAYYALQAGSPALGAASDGTNVGAWQGIGPEVERVDPSCASPGKRVKIYGSGFTDVQEVTFGANDAALSGKPKDNKIKVVVPEGPEGEEVDVTVRTEKGSGILVDGFRYPTGDDDDCD